MKTLNLMNPMVSERIESMVLVVVNNYKCYVLRPELPQLLAEVTKLLNENYNSVDDIEICLTMAESLHYWKD